MYCKECGNEINDKAVICPECGVPVEGKYQAEEKKVKKPPISRGWATIASLLIIGLGQILQGRVGRGLAILIGGAIVSLITAGIAAPIIWIISAADDYMWDAYKETA